MLGDGAWRKNVYEAHVFFGFLFFFFYGRRRRDTPITYTLAPAAAQRA